MTKVFEVESVKRGNSSDFKLTVNAAFIDLLREADGKLYCRDCDFFRSQSATPTVGYWGYERQGGIVSRASSRFSISELFAVVDGQEILLARFKWKDCGDVSSVSMREYILTVDVDSVEALKAKCFDVQLAQDVSSLSMVEYGLDSAREEILSHIYGESEIGGSYTTSTRSAFVGRFSLELSGSGACLIESFVIAGYLYRKKSDEMVILSAAEILSLKPRLQVENTSSTEIVNLPLADIEKGGLCFEADYTYIRASVSDVLDFCILSSDGEQLYLKAEIGALSRIAGWGFESAVTEVYVPEIGAVTETDEMSLVAFVFRPCYFQI